MNSKRYKYFDYFPVEHGSYAIRPVQSDDIQLIREWRNAQLDVLRQSQEISEKQQEAYFKDKIWSELDDPHPSTILVSLYFENCVIGYGGLVHISWRDKRAEVSFLLENSRALNAGVYEKDFSSFLYLLKELSFESIGLNRLYTETYDIRDHHISILEAAGFAREGVMRQHVIINQAPVDSIIHGCLSSYAR